MKNIYILLIICITWSCKQEAQTPETFLNTINDGITNMNIGMEQGLPYGSGLNDSEMLLTLDSISIKIKEAIDNISSLEEINDSLQLKKEVLLFLKSSDTLISIDYRRFLEHTINVQKSNSLSGFNKKLSTPEPSSIKIFKKAIDLIEDGIKIQEKVLLYHKVYNIPVPEYLKEAKKY